MPIFALALIPLMGLIGAAVDYSRANAVKAALQAALDSTALAMASKAATLSSTELRTQVQAYFDALFTKQDASKVDLNVSYSTANGPQITVSGTTNVATKFMRIPYFGINQVTVGANSTTAWGNTRLRVALVLDTTGSMNSANKMSALKTATKNLLTQLQSAATTNGDVYVSIIPFSKNVNIGSSNYNATWIDWTDWEAEPAVMGTWIANNNTATWEQMGPGDSCPFSPSTHGFRCASSPTSTLTVSYIPSSGAYAGYICPSTDSGSKDSTKIGIMYNGCYDSVESTRVISSGSNAGCGSAVNCSCSGSGSNKKCTQSYFQHNWIKNSRSTWNGCVTDRGTSSGPSNDYDRKVTVPGATADSKFPAEQNSYCSPEAMGLNYNWTLMKSLVDGLYPLGATNQPIGLVWGWQSLVGGGPFTAPAKDANYNYSEAIILMSDGLNTLDRWYGNGSSTNTSVDKRMYDTDGSGTCKNIKAAGITIYSIHVNTDGDPTSALLKNCASGSDKFWMITSANQLVTVFDQIGTKLSRLRVAK